MFHALGVFLLFATPVLAASAKQRPDVPRRAPALEELRKSDKLGAGQRDVAVPVPTAGGAELPARFNAAAPLPATSQVLAGHLLRRVSFGPTPADVNYVMHHGYKPYIERQLNYGAINDSALASRLPKPPGARDIYNDFAWMRRWYTRMVFSRRQLLERMTLIWHGHFATSNEKVGIALLMHKQEDLLRRYALRNFRDLLVNLTTDKAMLFWLDNDYNDGNAYDDQGNRILPNANYAREFLQLFSMGPILLNMSGEAVTDGNGVPLPSYSEQDVKEIARALSGWHIDYGHERFRFAIFDPDLHDSGPKTILGVTIPGRQGIDGRNEVKDVVDVVLGHQNVAPFIAKILIQKLATETPTPGYVERVATEFKNGNYDIKKALRAILNDPEFISDAVLRTQFKEPIEHVIGPIRSLGGYSKGEAPIYWSYYAKQLIYYPPSVFSFYPPGQKKTLINTALVTYRDRAADEFASGYTDSYFNPALLIKRGKLTTPAQAVDYLADTLLAAPLASDARDRIIAYMEGRVDDEKLRGAVWLILCSPDFQRN